MRDGGYDVALTVTVAFALNIPNPSDYPLIAVSPSQRNVE